MTAQFQNGDVRTCLMSLNKMQAGKKTMKEKEACDPRGISLVASHFSAIFFFFFFYCIPCRRSRFPQDLTAWLRGLLYTGSGPVSCFQPRWLLFHFNRLRFRTYLDERKTQGHFHVPARIRPVLLCMCVKPLSWLRFQINVEQKEQKDAIILRCMLSSRWN